MIAAIKAENNFIGLCISVWVNIDRRAVRIKNHILNFSFLLRSYLIETLFPSFPKLLIALY